MTAAEFYRQIESILETAPGTITGGELLADIPAWDSLAVLSFIAMVDEKFKVQFTGRDIAACATVAELKALLGDRIV